MAGAEGVQQQGVCIVRQGAVPLVNMAALAQAGIKTRTSNSCKPDLIFTMPAAHHTTIAATMLRHDGTAADMDAGFHDRLHSMARTFKHCMCLLPCTLAADPVVVDLLCSNSCAHKVLFHFLSPDDDATETAIALADALLAGVQDSAAAPADVLNLEQEVLQQEDTSLALQMVAAVTTEEALLSNLLVLPGLCEQEAYALLSAFGSLSCLVQASAEEMVEYAGCSHDRAVQLWELWTSAGQHLPAAAAALLNVS